MNRAVLAMNRVIAVAVCAALALPATAAPPRRDLALEAALRAHIAVLASDDYGGREPGTEGEARTLRYLARQWFDIGLVSGTNDPGNAWFAPVDLIARTPAAGSARFVRKGHPLYIAADAVLVLTSGERSLIENTPLLFVGDGRVVPPRAELAGRVALLLDGNHVDADRQNALLEAGAQAVLTVLDGPRTLAEVRARRTRTGYASASAELGGDLEAYISRAAFDRVLAGAQLSVTQLEARAAAPGFAAAPLDIAVTLEATTRETRIKTHNLIARLPGRHPDGGAVLVLAHWDGFGLCRPVGAPDRICNGAVDNASGLAALTEIARRLAKGPRPDRDVYFLATTGEELGLLGARAFADNPPLPLDKIVGAINIDSVAVAPAGTPLAVIGNAHGRLATAIAAVAKAQHRRVVESAAAATFLKRQDGWALLEHDVPAAMISSAFADAAIWKRFIGGDYHQPSDQVTPALELGGAAEDVAFLVPLARWLADPRKGALTAK